MIKVVLSVGELIDKITILQLKMKFIKNKEQLNNVKNELGTLRPLLKENNLESNLILIKDGKHGPLVFTKKYIDLMTDFFIDQLNKKI